MCTAITYSPKNFYFGRTLDADTNYSADVVTTPRGFLFENIECRHAIIGAAIVSGGRPLFFDGMNECGVCMAGLNFGSARYFPEREGMLNLAQYELLPYILGNCTSAAEAAAEFGRINITPKRFAPDTPPAPLHWLVADREGAFTAECMDGGMRICKNTVGVLTNDPPFACHMRGLSNYMHLTAAPPQNLFGAEGAEEYCAGLGAFGLPGDMSSPSRFIRAAFVRANAPSGLAGNAAVSQFFAMLSAVSVPCGACNTARGRFFTRYMCCMDAAEGVYYITPHTCRAVTAVKISRGDGLTAYAVHRGECILKLNF